MSYEYADIEIMVNELNASLPGSRVLSVELSQSYLKRMRPEGDLRQLIGFTFSAVERLGKALLFSLENEFDHLCFGSRLGDSAGWLILLQVDKIYPSWEAVIHLENNNDKYVLIFRDPKKTGKVEVREFAHEVDSLRVYGPEIKSSQFTIDWVQFFCGRHQMPIYELLQEPRYLPGVGKQLSSEILFRGNINPSKPAWSLTQTQIKRLFKSIHVVINSLITAKGKGIEAAICVYKREGLPCYVCQTPIRRDKIKKRFCYWCETCQDDRWKLPKPIAPEFVSHVVKTIGEPDAEKGDSS